jgi:hypothetical protein
MIRPNIVHKCVLGICFWLVLSGLLLAGKKTESPPNKPAGLMIEGRTISMKYEGTLLFKAEILGEGIKYHTNSLTETKGERITQILQITTESFQDSVEVVGQIFGSQESFPCEADRRDRGLALVRHSYGLSHSLLNRAVYDRNRDWAISVDHNPEVRITPEKNAAEGCIYNIQINGYEIIIRFRPRFYQKHRGMAYYEPWTYAVWPDPVVGWCSWFAYFQDITEEDVKKTADILSNVLLPYGYSYLQMDDGFQRDHGLPEYWLEPNDKFPHGLKHLAQYIKKKGLKPGIWTNVAFNQREFAEKNKEMFVLDDDGRVAEGNWIDMIVDGSNEQAVDRIIRPVYRGLEDMGWEYFKVDALRHLRYEGYNSHPGYFLKKGTVNVEAYRKLVMAIREEIAREHFMLGCWGIRPELIGIIDGCRIGTDGYSFAGLSQYNSFNNVVWRNDPDHIELSPEEAYRSTMVTSLTGSLFMLTDEPEVYLTDIVEPAKRAAPVLFTYPGQIFDVDPSRSQHLDRVGAEVSGSGPRIFDASRTPSVHLFLLEINKPFENWMLLGRTGGLFENIPFEELGLDEEKEYCVFEFWSKRLMGSFAGSFSPGEIDSRFNCQLFCIREKLDRPQVMATSRHITCGGYDLENTEWDGTALSGKSDVIANDPYILYIGEPSGYSYEGISIDEAKFLKAERKEGTNQIHILPDKNGTISWNVKYKKE